MILLGQILLWSHIVFGGLALLIFMVPLLTKKGGKRHKQTGKIYTLSMMLAAITAWTAIILRLATGRYDEAVSLSFLALVGLLAFENVFYGVRVLKQKRRTGPHTGSLEYVISGITALAGVAGLAYGLYGKVQILFVVFGALTVNVCIEHVNEMRKPPKSKWFWWYAHMGNMITACVATVTAFLVTNITTSLGGNAWMVWLAPTAIGVPGMIIWTRKERERLERAAVRS